LSARLGGHAAYLTHGDEADVSASYVRLHRILRSAAFDRLVRCLRRDLAWSFLHRLAGGLEGAPNAALVARQSANAAAAVATGHTLVAFGHTHAPSLERVGPATILNTGDWVRHRSYGIVRGESVALERYDG
jgi:predicted phosphodiesterase